MPKKLVGQEGVLGTERIVRLRSLLVRKVL